jgi:hypothetical protein
MTCHVVVSQDSPQNSSSEELLGKGCTDPTPYTATTEEISKDFEFASRLRGCTPLAISRINGSDQSSSHQRLNREQGKPIAGEGN